MKNERFDPSNEIGNIPELRVNKRCKNIIECLGSVQKIYWVIGISFLLSLLIIVLPENVWEYLWLRIRSQGTLTILILAFCAVAVSLVWKKGQRIDVWVFMALNMRGDRPPLLDWTMLAATQVGNGIFAVIAALVFFLEDMHILAYEIVLGTLSLWLTVELMKVLIRRTRPYIKLKNIRVVGARAGGHSFPSGHTSQSFFLATLLLHYFQADFATVLIMYVMAALVGITRIYVGMHYPRDVIGGAVLGTAWGLVGMIINNYIR